MASNTPRTAVSPKVKAAGVGAVIAGLAVAALTGVVNAVTPDMLAFLGPWAGLAYTVIIAIPTIVAGYVTEDPLRTAAASNASTSLTSGVDLGAPVAPLEPSPTQPAQSTTFGDPATPPPSQ
jgi:hypothetical protein